MHEYLPALTARTKWFQAVPSLMVGDLLLIVDYGTPRGCCPLGRIVTVLPGSDNVVRSAEMKTKFGLLRRPVAKLALLEECSPN